MSKVTVTYEFNLYEEESEFKRLVNSQEAHSVLWDVDQDIRHRLKHGDDDWLDNEAVCKYLESLREMIWESRALKDD